MNRLDYYSGNAAMGFMLYTGIVRAGWIRLSLRSSMARLGLLGALSAGLGAHMASGWGKIDYGLNMKVNFRWFGGLVICRFCGFW